MTRRSGSPAKTAPASEAPGAPAVVEPFPVKAAKSPARPRKGAKVTAKRASRVPVDVVPEVSAAAVPGGTRATHVTKAEFARKMGKYPAAVQTWLADGMPTVYTPTNPMEEYVLDFADCVAWLVQNKDFVNGRYVERKAKTGTASDTPPEKLSWEARDERQKALRGEGALDRENKQTVYLDEIVPVIVQALVQTRGQVLDVAGRVGPDLEGLTAAEIVAKLTKALDAALWKLSEGYLVDVAFPDADTIIAGAAGIEDEA
jgi:hypothetical protein